MTVIYNAKLRADQVAENETIDIHTVRYVLDELQKEAEDTIAFVQGDGFIFTIMRDIWESRLRWIQRQQLLLNGINPLTQEPFTDEELGSIRRLEEE